MTAYYNEIDQHAAYWLRELIKSGHIADGIVDERDIQDVMPNDLAGFTQCHFFAGIGGWSYALRKSGWPDDRHVWTGSCPCQPFSAAGKGAAFADERHLWPAFHHLIKECRPAVVIGEQVASKDSDPWIDLVHTDMEALGYAFGAIPFPSAGIGAPHIRDRLYWVGYSGGSGLAQRERFAGVPGGATGGDEGKTFERAGIYAGGMADNLMQQRQDGQSSISIEHEARGWQQGAAEASGLCDDLRPGPVNGFWRDADWLFCRDGKWRPVEPGTFPLVDGIPARVVRGGSDGPPIDADKTSEARVMRLRGYGNAINSVAAEAFIRSFLESSNGLG